MTIRQAADALAAGRTVTFRPRGGSMAPRVHDGELVTVRPFEPGEHPRKGDVVVCSVGGGYLLHLVAGVRMGGYLIANNHGKQNGFTSRDRIYGVMTTQPEREKPGAAKGQKK